MSVRNNIIKALVTAVTVLRNSDDYEGVLRSDPTPYFTNYLNTPSHETPLLMVADLGNETVLVRDSSYTRYAFDVQFRSFVAGESWADTQAKLNDIIGSMKKLIAKGPDLGTAVLAFQFVQGLGSAYDGDKEYGETDLLTRIIYVVENGEE